jgi:hypothetical protein
MYLCRACSYHEIADGNARAGGHAPMRHEAVCPEGLRIHTIERFVRMRTQQWLSTLTRELWVDVLALLLALVPSARRAYGLLFDQRLVSQNG